MASCPGYQTADPSRSKYVSDKDRHQEAPRSYETPSLFPQKELPEGVIAGVKHSTRRETAPEDSLPLTHYKQTLQSP